MSGKQEYSYEELRERGKRCVCRHCGSSLEIKFIIFCQYGGQGIELFCPQCQKIEYGIEPEIYQLAKELVEEYEFNYYVDMVEDERSKQLNIAKVGELFGWLFDRMHLCDEHGLTETYFNIVLK